jgi:MarR family transcriptional regulator, transcriptional regulator for hemolysin
MTEPLGRQLVFTAKAMREAFEDVLERTGASLGTWIVLNALSDTGIVSQSVLASHVRLEGATITHHVDRLEELGLVRRRLDPDDRRVRRLELTAAGQKLHEKLLAAAKEFETAVLAGLDAKERAALREALARISSNLERVNARSSGVGRGSR